ncbi:putative porin [Sphingomonas hengshuiensis]|uniref:Porin n=1 Tax=Sphingomonas hengshuiensis TaxID=1609977 RepID=A0A7U4J6Q7_9SPHN|nr:putative porin [Sphingomonas hengshuiensis]AJP71137.1 hypothetical protein TS85_03830 [Sphingomonas hengshuiensis]
MTTLFSTAGGAAILLALSGGAQAQTRATDPSTLDILDVLVEKGVLNRADADAVLAEARKRSEADAGTVRVPYVPEAVRAQVREEVKRDVIATAKSEGWAQPGAIPAWLDRFTLSGDMRVRGERQAFGGSNTPLLLDVNAINADGSYSTDDVLPLRSTTKDRYRGRIRARLAVDARISDGIDAGVRFTTGNPNDPTQNNQTLTGNFGKFVVGLDRAYIRARPFAKDGTFANTNLILGKFDNPFFSTELLFDRDLQFEGVAGTLSARLGDGNGAPEVFLTGGAFPLEEWDVTSDDKFLFAGQVGASGSPIDGFRLKTAVSLYEYTNVQGQYNTLGTRDNEHTAVQQIQFGNSVFNLRRDGGFVNTVKFGLASKFRVGAVTARAEFDVTPSLVAAIDIEAAKNFAFDRAAIDARDVPASSGDKAWYANVSIGHPVISAKNSWQLAAGYRRLEGDSTFDLFTDSDFGFGGTDQEGFVVVGSWAVARNLWLTGSWFSARTINLADPTTGTLAPPIDSDTFMFDLNVKF